MAFCKKPARGQYDKKIIRAMHKYEMTKRRERQRTRVADLDGRIRYFSKNSLPEYRNNENDRTKKSLRTTTST